MLRKKETKQFFMEEQTLAFKTLHKFPPTEQRSNTGCQAEP